MAATALGSPTENVRCLHGGAGPQQQRDHLDVAVLCRPMQRRPASAGRGGHEARPRRERTANKSCWKTHKCKLRIPKIVGPGRANIARHLTQECQEKYKERRGVLPMKKQ